jgi:hypothetical protein
MIDKVCYKCGLEIFGGKGDYWHVDSYGNAYISPDGHLAYPKEETMSNNEPTNNDPKNPISVLLEAAISMHELYSSFVAAGFTEAQALTLVAQTLRPQQNN